MTETPLSDFGVAVEADNQDERCQAFDEHGDRCPNVRESGKRFCSGCSADSALLTTADLYGENTRERIKFHWNGGTVRDILRDNYGFPPKDAVVLASGSAISTCQVLEGRLARAAAENEETFTVCQHTYTVERGHELLDRVRDRLTSGTFIEKWENCCLYVEHGSRCSQPRSTSVSCGFHEKRDTDDLLRVDEQLDRFGPETALDEQQSQVKETAVIESA